MQHINHNEPEVYFYHSDHLGSASWITDNGGIAVQHLQYLPYGEPFVDQRMSGYNERFTFTGKERDEETGYGYFGARYMDHELMTMWLSVDPMADKYPNVSPYNYCLWNPIKLVDLDGRDTTVGIDLVTGNVDYHIDPESYNGTFVNINYEGKQISSITIQGQVSCTELQSATNLSFTDYSEALLVYRNLIGENDGNMESSVEWNYYRQNNNEGGLVTSHQPDAVHLAGVMDRYNKNETASWRHFHPKLPNHVWYVPSKQDQQYAKEMGYIPCFLDFTGQSYRFDDIVKNNGVRDINKFPIPLYINKY